MDLAWGSQEPCASAYNFSPLATSVVLALRYVMAFLSLQFHKAPTAFEVFIQESFYTF